MSHNCGIVARIRAGLWTESFGKSNVNSGQSLDKGFQPESNANRSIAKLFAVCSIASDGLCVGVSVLDSIP